MDIVKDKVWNGAVNIRVEFNGSHYLLLAYRLAYFPLFYSEISAFFSDLTGNDITAAPVWLEYEDVPLKWNLPIGVLYDLFFLPGHKEPRGPWVLELKTQTVNLKYPDDSIIPFRISQGLPTYEKTLSQTILHSLKQSCYAINGNSRAMINLSEDDTKALWNSIQTHDYSIYHNVVAKITRGSPFQKIPIRVYVAGSSTLIQVPITVSEDGHPRTLGSALMSCLPSAFVKTSIGVAYIYGINVDLLFDQPILDVWQTFRHLDNFLYIVVLVS